MSEAEIKAIIDAAVQVALARVADAIDRATVLRFVAGPFGQTEIDWGKFTRDLRSAPPASPESSPLQERKI